MILPVFLTKETSMRFILLFCFLFTSLAFAGTSPSPTDYELVAASQSTQALGPVGGAGDILEYLIIVPETTAAGTVSIKDGSNTAINVLVTGTLSDLKPIIVHFGARSTSGAWQVTTGANVHVIGVGRFK
jgi:hypothetical protein